MGCFAHWWELNPAWSSIIPRGWFIRSSERAPIAFTANIRFILNSGRAGSLEVLEAVTSEM
jgi:hypothetical protein